MRVAALGASVLAALCFQPWVTHAAYSQLYKNYDMDNFFDEFNFFTDDDPTNGCVDYVDEATAWDLGLIRSSNDSIYMGVDYTDLATTDRGRKSVRIESKEIFTRGLFLLQVDHMPFGCGTWPAFWTVGEEWPRNGEIDIIEGVHDQGQNLMALHTSPGCRLSPQSNPPELTKSLDCDVDAPYQSKNQGCSLKDPKPQSFGRNLNEWGGGTFAMEWTSGFIKVWTFPKGAEPEDLWGDSPEPLGWGNPAGLFQGDCEVDKFFTKHRIVFNITFCGDWAGNTWESDGCAAYTGKQSCSNYVRNNPAAFEQAYWDISALRVWRS